MMKKQILNIGKTLNKAEQKQVFGGADPILSECVPSLETCILNAPNECPEGQVCQNFVVRKEFENVVWYENLNQCVCPR